MIVLGGFGDNLPMRLRSAARAAATVAATAAVGLLAACGGSPARPDPVSSITALPVPTAPTEARAQLAALVALAKDRRMVAFYTLRTPGQPDRTVSVTLASDRSWRIDIPGGALAGTVDVAIAARPSGLYQCVLPSARQPGGGCVRVAGPDAGLPARLDPRVTHVFIEWREVLTDRRAPLSVARAQPPAGASGRCFSVEITSASLDAPMDPGIYCYRPDGTLTAAIAGFGTLLLAGEPAAAPPSARLPGPVIAGAPLGTAAPPTPSPPPTAP
jgi:hypothetical protein